MNYTEITSRNNDKIKYVRKLSESNRERRSAQLFVLEGARLCFDAVRSGYSIKELYVTTAALHKYSDKVEEMTECAKQTFLITDEVADKLSETTNSQGVFCVVEMKCADEKNIDFKGKYIALENVQNPQNLGAVARTAEALGVSGVIVSDGCDIYNPKALRASMGSLMRIPVIESADLYETIETANENAMLTFVTVPDETASDITKMDFSGGCIAVIGNEGSGVSQEMKEAAQKSVTIKMKGEAESLNASAAAVITMWEMMR